MIASFVPNICMDNIIFKDYLDRYDFVSPTYTRIIINVRSYTYIRISMHNFVATFDIAYESCFWYSLMSLAFDIYNSSIIIYYILLYIERARFYMIFLLDIY